MYDQIIRQWMLQDSVSPTSDEYHECKLKIPLQVFFKFRIKQPVTTLKRSDRGDRILDLGIPSGYRTIFQYL